MLIVVIKAKDNREKHNVNFWFAKSMQQRQKWRYVYASVLFADSIASLPRLPS